jgi:hypothetical protein
VEQVHCRISPMPSGMALQRQRQEVFLFFKGHTVLS